MTMLSEQDIALAGEYVLNLLDSADAARVAARIATDGDFAAEVEAWRLRLLPMLDGCETPARDHIWSNIAANLAPVQNTGKSTVRVWQATSFVSAAIAAVFAAILYMQPAPAPDQPLAPLVASLGGSASLTASYDEKHGEMLLTPVSLNTDNLYPELWIIPADGKARSLGIVAGDHATLMEVPAQMRGFMRVGATLAITPEPMGGAPNGIATGPVIASGKIISL